MTRERTIKHLQTLILNRAKADSRVKKPEVRAARLQFWRALGAFRGDHTGYLFTTKRQRLVRKGEYPAEYNHRLEDANWRGAAKWLAEFFYDEIDRCKDLL